jgi:cytoskeletal protein RodZ
MKACPNCGKPVRAETSVCECGELLRAEVTHVQAWETETVFGARPTPINKRRSAGVIALAIALTIVGIAWIGIRQNLISASSGNNDEVPPAATSTASDTHDDDLTSSALSSQEGVFIFSSSSKSTRQPSTGLSARSQKVGDISTPSTDANPATEPSLDQNLQSDKSEAASSSASENKQADCKPELALKKPEPTAPADTKPAAPKTGETSRTYFLGPRGGCFFVASGGAKKYVDRSLCPQPAITAARQ